jgi:RNA polymerase sigma-70 factor (ECF subfamily)
LWLWRLRVALGPSALGFASFQQDGVTNRSAQVFHIRGTTMNERSTLHSNTQLADVEQATRLTAGAGKLATTRWSVVVAAAGEGSQARAALDELCRLYWGPALAFVRRHRGDAEAALDITQQFFLDLVRRDELSRLSESNGRFRPWLYQSLRNALANDWRFRTRQVRDERRLLWLDAVASNGAVPLEPADPHNPEQLFAAACALAVYTRARELTRSVYCARGQAAVFDAAIPDPRAAMPAPQVLADWVAASGANPNAMKQKIFRIRIAFRGVLYREIAQTVSSTAELEDEIRFLIASLPGAA